MTEIARYYTLLFDIEVSDYRLSLFNRDSNSKNELEKEININQSLNQDFSELRASLSNDQTGINAIKAGLIHIANGYLDSFSKIEKWNGQYPDLNQGMVIQGYLFGLLLNDFKTSLTSEGNYCPVTHIYMSAKEWPAKDLENLLILIKGELMSIEFRSKMDAINYYEKIKKEILKQINVLRQLGIIY